MSDSKDPEKQERRITVWPQWLAACAVSLAPLVSGLANGWSSPYLAQLTSTTADIPITVTDYEASWIASLLNLGRFFGALIGSIIQGKKICVTLKLEKGFVETTLLKKT